MAKGITLNRDTPKADTNVEVFGTVKSAPWVFGQPTLMSQGNGAASWERGDSTLSTHQKGSTGWVAKLHAGIQSGWDDAAEMYVPVNEMPLPDLTVGTTMWSWFQTDTEIAGLGMVIWVHDPNDFDKRAEISMLAEVGHIELAAGWNAHELANGNDCIWYGENTGSHDTTVTAGSPYDFSKFLTDDVFSTYTIYRISFAHGFQTTNADFDPVYLADVKINGVTIPLKPDSNGSGLLERYTFIEHPFGKNTGARSDGVQYSAEVTSDAAAYKTVESVTVDPHRKGKIIELEIGITWSQKSSSTTKYVRGRIQARNKGGTWVDIIDDGTSPASGNAYVEDAASAAAYTSHTFSGRITTEANLDKIPFDIQVQVFPETQATESATGKVKNSSYIKVTYDGSH